MIPVPLNDSFLEIRPVTPENYGAILEVYRQCEDFLALGPVATASMEMVRKDLEISKNEGGIFCGIHLADGIMPEGIMIGVLDYVPNYYHGNPQAAYLALLMIASPFRSQGIGKAVVEAFENEVTKDDLVTVIFAGVQVNNPRALRFWQKQGYRVVSEPRLYPDQTVAVDLQKDISPRSITIEQVGG